MSERGVFALGSHLARQMEALAGRAEGSESTRRALAEHASRHGSPSGRSRRVPALVTVLAGTALGAASAAGLWLLRDRPLRFTVGESPRPGVLYAWQEAPQDGGLPIRFSDGTKLRLEQGARAQVLRLGARGANILVGSGRVLVDVVPRDRGEWSVRSGPFVVEVKGTRFEVGWDPTSEVFSLDLLEGKVVVKGCEFGEGRAIAQGERLRASCREAEGAALRAPDPAPSGSLSAPLAGAAGAFSSELGGVGAGAGQTELSLENTSERESWRTLARAGHFRQAYAAAAARGFDAQCEAASASDAMLLGDAARLSAENGAARRAYLGVRRRFARSQAAAQAAFVLGRLDFDSGDPSAAMRWFEAYLAEQPSGALAQPAFDRLLEASLRSGDEASQRAVAERYLARYPSGARAGEARRILAAEPRTEQ